ncbi:TDP-N-acetylfucosamine:lipid II N-acetylfucosaminyltransferase [Halomonas organivorans]
MARKQPRRGSPRLPKSPSGLSAEARQQLRADNQAQRYRQLLDRAKALAEQQPVNAEAHAWLAQARYRLGKFEAARRALEAAVALEPCDAESLNKIGEVFLDQGEARQAERYLRAALTRFPEDLSSHYLLSKALYAVGRYREALEHNERCLAAFPDDIEMLKWKGLVLIALKRMAEAEAALKKVLSKSPDDFAAHNNLGILYLSQAEYDKAECHYQAAHRLEPEHEGPACNLISARHYNPRYTAEELYRDLVKRGRELSPERVVERAQTPRQPGRRLRVGLLSGGFRAHPAGQMTLPAIEALDKDAFELFAYTTNEIRDLITERFMARVDHWCPVAHLAKEQLDARIRDDGVDILIDMNGMGDESRFPALALEPAPLLVKWVGSLINTTGLESFDYLISDHIETPEGVDGRYVEKLIRLPDDYICYHAPDYAPEHSALPALKNGYITFGCLNNPAKLSPELLEAWARLMNEVPGSRLLLRGKQFDSEEFCNKIRAIMARHDIAPSRLILEGPAEHREFLATYQRIDIALDTWPYSGGLTTCEALLMGVPVVTRTGPAFAGRHSATHLTNAGLPELVTDNWEDYRRKVKELVADLPNLAVIRAALRTVLKDSPVCDGERFARHLTSALRAIWQRHCEGHSPAALSFDQEGRARFEDEEEPAKLRLDRQGSFDWSLESPLMVLDNGGNLASRPGIEWLLGSGEMAMLVFDPAERLKTAGHLSQYGEFQHFPQVGLGDGQPLTLYAAGDVGPATTLVPLEEPEEAPQAQPIASVALDSIEGLGGIDVLALDDRHDSLRILDHGRQALSDTLLIQARVRFHPTHAGQPELGSLLQWAWSNGFRFYCFHDADYRSHFPERYDLGGQLGSELISADALFLPSQERIERLPDRRRVRLAFILSQLYRFQDAAYALLAQQGGERGDDYLESEGLWRRPSDLEQSVQAGTTRPGRSRFVHIGFNNMNLQGMIDVLQEPELCAGHDQEIFIARPQAMPGHDVDVTQNVNAHFFDIEKDLTLLEERCQADEVVAVFFHGLFFDWQKGLLKRLGGGKNAIWVIWGGDLYTPIKNGTLMLDEVACLSGVVAWRDGDYSLFKNHYGEKERVPFRYFNAFDYDEVNIPSEKQKLIVVGNSGDPSNEHMAVLEILSKKLDIQEYRIIMPVSYNVQSGYVAMLREHAEKLGLADRVDFLESILPPKEYFEMLAKAEVTIMAHNRQQAGGNIVASVLYGNKVVMRQWITGFQEGRRLNPIWEDVVEKAGCDMTDFIDFVAMERLSDLKVEEGEDARVARERLASSVSKKTAMGLMAKGFASLMHRE